MKITLVEPSSGYCGSIYTHAGSVLEPLGIEYIGAYASEQLDCDITIVSQGETPTANFIRLILDTNPDIVGFSVFTYTFPLACNIAKGLKTVKSSLKIVFGGYHPTAQPEIVKEDYIDFVISGEGEIKFARLVSAIKNGKGFNQIPGVISKTTNNSNDEVVEDINSLPHPLRQGDILKKCKLLGMYYPTSRHQISPSQVICSRGCPHSCNYCASFLMWNRKVRWRSTENIVEELEALITKFGTNLVCFSDLIFNLNKKKVVELCNAIISRKLDLNWFCSCRPDCIDEELLEYMKMAGCRKIHYGIESLNELHLFEAGRKHTCKDINYVLKMTHRKSIIVRGYLMIGYPSDTHDTLKEMAEKVKTLFLDDLRISFFTPLPGTELYKKAYEQGKLLTHDFSLYNTDEPVMKIPALTRDDLLEARRKIHKEFYFSREYEQRRKEKLEIAPFLKESYDELFDCLRKSGVR